MDDDIGARVVHRDRDVERRRIAHVVAVRLEGGPEHGHALVGEGAAEGLASEVDSVGAAAQVDLVDLAQEHERLVSAEFTRTCHEGPDVLGQAAAAEAEPSREEAAADARVVADRLGELRDIGAGRLADLGHRVDEGDLRREEGVRGDLHEFGGREVGDEEGNALGDHRRIDLAEEVFGALAVRSDDEAIRVERVLDCEALAQELGVPGHFDARRGNRLELLLDHRRGTDRHRRLADDKCPRLEERCQTID